MANIDLDYLVEDVDRHGNRRRYVRRAGRKVRLRERPGTAAFLSEYHAGLEKLDARPETDRHKRGPKTGTFGWLAASYFASTEFKGLDVVSQTRRRAMIEACMREPLRPGAPQRIGDVPCAMIGAAHLRLLRDRRSDKPGAANNRLKWLSALLGWAVERDHIKSNPARDVKRVQYATEGFHAWTTDEVRQFEAHYPIGSKARLALALLLYLGVRRGDVVKLGRPHVNKSGGLSFVPSKTSYRRHELSHKPILPELAAILAASPIGDLTFLVTDYGRPFTAAGFGGWFRDRCNEAGLPQCSAHGLRKAGATMAAENGATIHQLMAMFDWATPAQAKIYTDKADRKRLTAEGMGLLREQSQNTECPTAVSHLSKELK